MSSFANGSYMLGVARSTSGHIRGPWQQDTDPLYTDDGGHGMVFRTFDGELMLTMHRPNTTLAERPIFVPLNESHGKLCVA